MRKYHPRFFGFMDPLGYGVIDEFAIFPASTTEVPKTLQALNPKVVVMLPKARLFLDEDNIRRIHAAFTIILSNLAEEREKKEEEERDSILRCIPQNRPTEPGHRDHGEDRRD